MTVLVLAFLQMTFVIVLLMMLHMLKRSIGAAPFYATLGMLFLLGQLIGSCGILIDPGWAGFQVNLGYTVLLSPYMAAILIVYIVDGTLEAQRLIMGLLAVVFGYFALATLTANQLHTPGITIPDPYSTTLFIDTVFIGGRRILAAAFLAHSVDLFVLPILFQFFRNRNCRLLFCVLVTLILAQVVDVFVYQLVAAPVLPNWWEQLRMTYLGRLLIMLWLGVLTTAYVRGCQTRSRDRRRPLDILVAFFGGYGRARQLQRNLQEWAGRYRIIVQNASDLILILDAQGAVLNANQAAARLLGRKILHPGFRLAEVLQDQNGQALDWPRVWTELHRAPATPGTAAAVVRHAWHATAANATTRELDASVSPAELHDHSVAVVIARDITERRQLQRRRHELEEQLYHAQRMEAIGQLAGGVAHDFNNLLHSVEANLEHWRRTRPTEESESKYIGNIRQATARASKLVQQLLGFARKGKYSSEKLDIVALLEADAALFESSTPKNTAFKFLKAPTSMHIRGDRNQIEQVFLNLLLNARDAVMDCEHGGRIVLRVEPAAAYTPGWQRHGHAEAKPADYICVRIKDNGVGIPAAIRAQIFDPFFTTKPTGKGTGMGLAMAYGTVDTHHGWIHVESEADSGAEFFVFLPRA